MANSIKPLIVADSDYGLRKEPWDQKAWGLTEFKAVMNLARQIGVVKGRDGISTYTSRAVIFLTCGQLEDAMQAVKAWSSEGWRFRLLTWVKGQMRGEGHKFINDTEHILVVWNGTEADIVTNIPSPDAPDRARYSTALRHDRLQANEREHFDGGAVPVNPYQKPVSLMRQLLDMFAPEIGSVIIDLTCGSGSTGVWPAHHYP